MRIAGRRDGGGAGSLLSVEDDGPGIRRARATTALARGGRLDATSPGAGLGLAIVGDLVEAYGGSLASAVGARRPARGDPAAKPPGGARRGEADPDVPAR